MPPAYPHILAPVSIYLIKKICIMCDKNRGLCKRVNLNFGGVGGHLILDEKKGIVQKFLEHVADLFF